MASPFRLFYGFALCLGFVALIITTTVSGDTRFAARLKLTGDATYCSWEGVWNLTDRLNRQGELERSLSDLLAVEDFDAALQIEKVKSPGRAFWIKPSGTVLNGAELLRFLLAEHEWMLEVNPDLAPQPDDVVIDCGAHVGTFADMALGRGASKVIAIEPDPTHVECLRRNFSEEIKNGRVIVVPKAVWSKPGTMKLTIGTKNSGMNSLVNEVGSQTIDVEVTTVDEIVAGLNLDRVDYIKMDIEGAEKEALKGAQTVISRFVPRLMLESNSTPEGVVEPSFVETIWPGYSMTAGACEPAAQLPIVLIPHVLYYYPQPRP